MDDMRGTTNRKDTKRPPIQATKMIGKDTGSVTDSLMKIRLARKCKPGDNPFWGDNPSRADMMEWWSFDSPEPDDEVLMPKFFSKEGKEQSSRRGSYFLPKSINGDPAEKVRAAGRTQGPIDTSGIDKTNEEFRREEALLALAATDAFLAFSGID